MSPPPTPAATIASGMMWISVGVVASKLISMISQFVLAFLLDPRSFGIFSISLVAVTLISALQTSAVQKILIHRQDEYGAIVGHYTSFSAVLGVLGGLAMVVVGYGLSRLYALPEIVAVTAILALTVPLICLCMVYSADLSIRRELKAISMVEVAGNLTYGAGVILLAFLGTDYLTLAVSAVIAAVVRFTLYARRAGRLRFDPIGTRGFLETFGSMRWLMYASMAFSLTQQGDYMVLGLILDEVELGYYFFGFQITLSIILVIATSFVPGLMPAYAKAKDDQAELRRLVLQSTSIVFYLTNLIAIGLVGLGPALIHWVWGGKWDPSIPVVVLLALSWPTNMLASTATVLMEAAGRWRLRAMVLTVDAAGIMGSAGVGGWLGGIEGAAAAVALYRAFSGLLGFLVIRPLIGLTPAELAGYILRLHLPLLAWAPALLLIAGRLTDLDRIWPTLPLLIALSSLAAAVFAAVLFLVDRTVYGMILDFARAKAGRILRQRAPSASTPP